MDVLMNVRRFMGGILLLLGRKGTGIRRKKKSRAWKRRRLLSQSIFLEQELQCKLHDPRVMGSGCCQEIARTERSTHTIELSVIEGVVCFPAEFDGLRLLNRELFKEAHIEIGAMGAIQH